MSEVKRYRFNFDRITEEEIPVESVDGKFVKYEDYDKLKEEYKQVKKIREDYATSARAIAVWLNDYKDENLSYDKMIAECARRAAKEIDKLKQENELLRLKITDKDMIITKQMEIINSKCNHYFHFYKNCTTVRCEKCQAMFPVQILNKYPV